MLHDKKLLRFILVCCVLVVLSLSLFGNYSWNQHIAAKQAAQESNFIKWVEFDVPLNALQKAGQADIDTYGETNHVNWIESLACLASKYGGSWKKYKGAELDEIIKAQMEGKSAKDLLTYNKDLYDYYVEAYTAVLGGFIGEFQSEQPDENGGTSIVHSYGVKVFSPVAAGYGYSHYEDFRSNRSYGFSRPHVGNDLLGNIGTPLTAVESGTIECMGWNQYGGWRIGIRSFDKKRYYYYAHMRSGHPYVNSLKEGDTVQAGDVIGYLGMTGYSTTEDVNNMTKPHLHFGLQLIFDESQKECQSEIWVDVYDIVNFLSKHRSEVQLNKETGEYERKYAFDDSIAEQEDEPEQGNAEDP